MNLRLSMLILVLLPQVTLAQQQSNQYGSCSYACKSIPPDSEVARYFGQDSANYLKSKKLSVLAWNIYKGRGAEFIPAFQFLSKDRDLVLLSEATTSAPVTNSFDLLRNFGWNFSVSFLMKENIGTGTAIGSYARPFDVHHYRTRDLEPMVNSPKAMTVAKFSIAGTSEKLMVISIHGINWVGDDAIVRQVQQVLPDIKAHNGPVLFAGDFNFKNQNRVTLVSNLLATVGVTRVPWQNPLKKQLDDAFTRGLKVNKAFLNQSFIDTGSDHPAIELELEVVPGFTRKWQAQNSIAESNIAL